MQYSSLAPKQTRPSPNKVARFKSFTFSKWKWENHFPSRGQTKNILLLSVVKDTFLIQVIKGSKRWNLLRLKVLKLCPSRICYA